MKHFRVSRNKVLLLIPQLHKPDTKHMEKILRMVPISIPCTVRYDILRSNAESKTATLFFQQGIL